MQKRAALLKPQQYRHFSIFDYFKRKQDVDETAAKSQQVEEPVAALKEAQPVVSKVPRSTVLKQEIKDLDRAGDDNLFGKYKATRRTVRERNAALEDLLHPDLLANERVSIQKFSRMDFKRGLQAEEGEHPFP